MTNERRHLQPAALDPEHPEQLTVFAPPESVALSPSYVFSLGPEVMDPELASTIQFTAFFMLAVVPEIDSGSHTYVLRIRLEDTHL